MPLSKDSMIELSRLRDVNQLARRMLDGKEGGKQLGLSEFKMDSPFILLHGTGRTDVRRAVPYY